MGNARLRPDPFDPRWSIGGPRDLLPIEIFQAGSQITLLGAFGNALAPVSGLLRKRTKGGFRILEIRSGAHQNPGTSRPASMIITKLVQSRIKPVYCYGLFRTRVHHTLPMQWPGQLLLSGK